MKIGIIVLSSLAILSIFSFLPAFATVTINGQVTFGTSSANIVANSSAITANSIKIDSTGITTSFQAGDALNKYQFSSATVNPVVIQWKTLSSSELDFKRLSSVTDVLGTTTATNQLYNVNVDGSNIGVAFANGINNFNSNAGILINEILSGSGSTPGGSPAGGGGGGAAATQLPPASLLPQTATSTLAGTTLISVIPKTYQASFGTSLPSESFQFSWNSTNDIYINSIQIGTSPIAITFPQLPLLLKGNTNNNPTSTSLVPFTLMVPQQCDPNTPSGSCATSTAYNIPVTFNVVTGNQATGNQTAIITSTVSVDLTRNPSLAIFVVFSSVAAIAIGGFLYRFYTSKHKPSRKKHDGRPDKEIQKYIKKVEKDSIKRLKH